MQEISFQGTDAGRGNGARVMEMPKSEALEPETLETLEEKIESEDPSETIQ